MSLLNQWAKKHFFLKSFDINMLNEGACDSSIDRWYCGGCGSPSQTQELCSASDQKSADGAGASLAHLHHGKEMSKQWH